MRRALAAGLALLFAATASGSAQAWTVPGAGDAAALPAIDGSWGAAGSDLDGRSLDGSMGTPLESVGDRLGSDIEQFSQPGLGPMPFTGSEMLHWTQMMALAAVPVAAVASRHGQGASSALNAVVGPLAGPFGQGKAAPTPAPEPGSLWLFALSAGLLLAGLARRSSGRSQGSSRRD